MCLENLLLLCKKLLLIIDVIYFLKKTRGGTQVILPFHLYTFMIRKTNCLKGLKRVRHSLIWLLSARRANSASTSTLTARKRSGSINLYCKKKWAGLIETNLQAYFICKCEDVDLYPFVFPLQRLDRCMGTFRGGEHVNMSDLHSCTVKAHYSFSLQSISQLFKALSSLLFNQPLSLIFGEAPWAGNVTLAGC